MAEENIVQSEGVENKVPEAPKGPQVVIQVIMNENGSLMLKSSLPLPMVIYAFETLKFNMLNDSEKKIIESPKGGIMNFARRFKK